MSPAQSSEITRLLEQWNHGDRNAFDRLAPLVYNELRELARQRLRAEKPGHTLQPTALVNEFYLRLVGQREVDWQNRAHFFGAASRLMRRIIVDYARTRRARKRGYGAKLELTAETPQPEPLSADDLVALNEALEQLEKRDSPAATSWTFITFWV